MSTTTRSQPTTDRIEKQVRLRHPRARVWRALTDSRELGKWFGARFTAPFAPGARVRGKVTHPGYEHLTMEVVIERMEPEGLFAWRWHPGGVEPDETFRDDQMTLVVFELKEVPDGTLLTVVESGFDRVPLERRAQVMSDNEGGWTAQMEAIAKHLDAVA